jgi:LmbE family N-acetylglucosaminyl deacetylase
MELWSRPLYGRLDMPTVILSPHLDDAVLSCWHLLTGLGDVKVVSVFAGVPEGAAGWWDRMTGTTDSGERVRIRRAEDLAALAAAGRTAVHLDLLDAQYRANGSDPSVLEAVGPHLAPEDSVCVPAALGAHRDHQLVRDAGLALRDRGHDVSFYADLPHVVMEGPPGALDLRADLQGLAPETHFLAYAEFERKLAAVGCYATQIEALEQLAPLRLLRREVIWRA